MYIHLHVYIHMYIHMYKYTFTCIYSYTYIYNKSITTTKQEQIKKNILSMTVLSIMFYIVIPKNLEAAGVFRPSTSIYISPPKMISLS